MHFLYFYNNAMNHLMNGDIRRYDRNGNNLIRDDEAPAVGPQLWKIERNEGTYHSKHQISVPENFKYLPGGILGEAGISVMIFVITNS